MKGEEGRQCHQMNDGETKIWTGTLNETRAPPIHRTETRGGILNETDYPTAIFEFEHVDPSGRW